MAVGEGSKEPYSPGKLPTRNGEPKDRTSAASPDDDDDDDDDGRDDDDDEDEEDEEEPRLKYATVTNRLNSLFRNGDAVSSFLVAGDKMVGIIDTGELALSDTLLTRCL